MYLTVRCSIYRLIIPMACEISSLVFFKYFKIPMMLRYSVGLTSSPYLSLDNSILCSIEYLHELQSNILAFSRLTFAYLDCFKEIPPFLEALQFLGNMTMGQHRSLQIPVSYVLWGFCFNLATPSYDKIIYIYSHYKCLLILICRVASTFLWTLFETKAF